MIDGYPTSVQSESRANGHEEAQNEEVPEAEDIHYQPGDAAHPAFKLDVAN